MPFTNQRVKFSFFFTLFFTDFKGLPGGPRTLVVLCSLNVNPVKTKVTTIFKPDGTLAAISLLLVRNGELGCVCLNSREFARLFTI